MISQIVRLDAPYNIICSKSGQFGLHIATLIVVKEKIADATDGKKNSGSVTMENYPIVNTHNMDGQTWKDTELKDCLVICRQGGSASLSNLYKVMEFTGKDVVAKALSRLTPITFFAAMIDFKVDFHLPTGEDGCTVSKYDVPLTFEKISNGTLGIVYVYSSKGSLFYFNDSYIDKLASPLATKDEALKRLTDLRDCYMMFLRHLGLRSITFSTNNEDFQWFVDKLNGTNQNG